MRTRAELDLRILPIDKAKEAYKMRGRCENCGARFDLLIPRGEEAPGKRRTILGIDKATCSRCGCRTVVVDD